MEDTERALGAPFGRFREISTQVVADVDGDGVLRRRWIRMTLQVTTGTVTEHPWIEVVEGDDGAPVFTEAAGARVARTYDHPSGEAYGVVLGLERAVTAPDTTALEWVTDYPEDEAPTVECMHGRSRPGGELLLRVRFDPRRLPTWCEEFTDDGAAPLARPLGSGGTVHAVRRGFGPGVLGLRWTW